MRTLRLLLRKILYKITFFYPSLLSEDIVRLENQGKIDAARKLRKSSLQNLSLKYAGPLWTSEGEDLLYVEKNYKEALSAFQNAIKSNFTPSINPLRIYCGASTAAVMISDFKLAEKYYDEALEWYDKLKEGNNLDSYLSKFDDTLIWLKNEILNHAKVANKQFH
jgi:tetratricopeptide (TPR) repeat protein